MWVEVGILPAQLSKIPLYQLRIISNYSKFKRFSILTEMNQSYRVPLSEIYKRCLNVSVRKYTVPIIEIRVLIWGSR